METHFKIDGSEFKKMMLDAKKVSKYSKGTLIKISVQPINVEFGFVGMVRTIKGETEGYCDAFVPFEILLSVAQTNSKPELDIIIKDGEFCFGISKICINSIKVNSLFSGKEVSLPVNPTIFQILRLRKEYDEETLSKNKYLKMVESAEARLEERIYDAYRILADYGVSKKDIEKLIEGKINGE